MIDIKEIEKIAVLSRLDLSDKEKETYADQLSVIFDYMKLLEEVDVEGVTETCQVTGLEDVFEDDKVKQCSEEARKKLIALFPEKSGELLKVQQVFDSNE